MKKTVILITSFMLFFTIFIFKNIDIYASEYRDFSYEKQGGNIRILKYTGKNKKVVIPDKIQGKKVTSIKEGAFNNCKNLKELTLGKNVKSLGVDIESLGNLYSSLENGESIAKTICDECIKLENINVKKNNTKFKAKNGVLYSKSGKEILIYPSGKKNGKFKIPNKVVKIKAAAFSNSKHLVKVSLGNNVTDIEQGAFWKSGITSFEVPDNTDYIGNECFAFCKKLKKVNIGKKLRWFELNHFWGCANLQKINLNKIMVTCQSKCNFARLKATETSGGVKSVENGVL